MTYALESMTGLIPIKDIHLGTAILPNVKMDGCLLFIRQEVPSPIFSDSKK